MSISIVNSVLISSVLNVKVLEGAFNQKKYVMILILVHYWQVLGLQVW